MENLKIRVNSEVENKEVQGIFKILGGAWSEHVNADHYDKEFLYLTNGVIEYDDLLFEFLAVDECKEITLPQLRDLVVLKRNDVGDATHVDQYGDKWIFVSGIWYFYSGKNKWDQTLANLMLRYELKPIEKEEMKTKKYLMPSDDYKLIKAHRKEGNDWIEIPDGANFAWKSDGKYVFFTALEMGYRDASVVWSRHTHPEELPFIDDESPLQTEIEGELDRVENLRELLTPYTQPLNNQYAEIEKVRQSAWQKQEGGAHYKNLKIQPMQYALENKLDYAQANVVKYVTRHKEKNGKEDLLKAIHNIELMIEFYYGEPK